MVGEGDEEHEHSLAIGEEHVEGEEIVGESGSQLKKHQTQ